MQLRERDGAGTWQGLYGRHGKEIQEIPRTAPSPPTITTCHAYTVHQSTISASGIHAASRSWCSLYLAKLLRHGRTHSHIKGHDWTIGDGMAEKWSIKSSRGLHLAPCRARLFTRTAAGRAITTRLPTGEEVRGSSYCHALPPDDAWWRRLYIDIAARRGRGNRLES